MEQRRMSEQRRVGERLEMQIAKEREIKETEMATCAEVPSHLTPRQAAERAAALCAEYGAIDFMYYGCSVVVKPGETIDAVEWRLSNLSVPLDEDIQQGTAEAHKYGLLVAGVLKEASEAARQGQCREKLRLAYRMCSELRRQVDNLQAVIDNRGCGG